MRLPALSIAAAALLLSACSTTDTRRVEVLRDTALVNWEKGDLVMAEAKAREVLTIEPNDAQALTILAMTRLRRGASVDDVRAIDDAIATFERVEALGADTYQVEYGHGMALGKRARVFLMRAEALGRLATAAASGPADGTSASRSQLISKLEAAAATDITHAEQHLLAAYRLKSNFAELLDEIQSLYALKQDFPRAVEWGEKSLELIAKFREERFAMRKRAGGTGSVDDIVRTDLQRFDLREANCRSLLALTLFRMGRVKEAATNLDRVLEIDPDRTNDYRDRGVCRQTLGEFAGAARDFETFVRKSSLPVDSPVMHETWDRLAECRKHLPAGLQQPLSAKP